jgi:Spy/CpxP family protein refolding chaperone
MKRLILACSLIGAIAIATTAQAQPEHHGQPPEPQERAVHLQKTLQLSDEQTAKVKTILESSAQQRKALMEKYKPQLQALHADGKALREQTESQINGVLTPKQQVAFKAQLEKREQMMRKHMHGHDGEMPMEPPAE